MEACSLGLLFFLVLFAYSARMYHAHKKLKEVSKHNSAEAAILNSCAFSSVIRRLVKCFGLPTVGTKGTPANSLTNKIAPKAFA
jgi:hypothetical protein